MTQRYRDLPVVDYSPPPIRQINRPEEAKWSGLSISPRGSLYLTFFEEESGAIILDEEGRTIALKLDHGSFRFPNVQRFADGRWLVVESRTSELEPNAFVFESDGSFSHSFYVGDGIETVLIDPFDRVWIGYFDEGVFGSFGLPEKAQQFGQNGLIRVNDRGEVDFGFNNLAGDRMIDDIYALTIDENGVVWLCPYGEFFVATVDNDRIEFPLSTAPVSGTTGLSVGPNHIVFLAGMIKSACLLSLSVSLIACDSSNCVTKMAAHWRFSL